MNELITEKEFNEIPTFFHNGKECIDFNGDIVTKNGLRNFLITIGILITK